MKKFVFSFQKILDVKNQELNKLKFELEELNLELENIKKDINILNQHYKDTGTELNSKMSNSISVFMLKSYMVYLDGINKNIKDKEFEEKAILNKIENKREEILETYQEVSKFNKLKEKEMEAHNYELKREEQLQLDEFVANRIVMKLVGL